MTLLFFFYPTITQMTLSLFNCQTVEGVEYLTRDLSVTCWKGKHLFWVLVNGVPMSIIWIIGLPLCGFLMLTKNRKNLWLGSVLSKYWILYIGLKAHMYFWEFINTFWKVSLLMINVFVENMTYKVLGSLTILVVVLFI